MVWQLNKGLSSTETYCVHPDSKLLPIVFCVGLLLVFPSARQREELEWKDWHNYSPTANDSCILCRSSSVWSDWFTACLVLQLSKIWMSDLTLAQYWHHPTSREPVIPSCWLLSSYFSFPWAKKQAGNLPSGSPNHQISKPGLSDECRSGDLSATDFLAPSDIRITTQYRLMSSLQAWGWQQQNRLPCKSAVPGKAAVLPQHVAKEATCSLVLKHMSSSVHINFLEREKERRNDAGEGLIIEFEKPACSVPQSFWGMSWHWVARSLQAPKILKQ